MTMIINLYAADEPRGYGEDGKEIILARAGTLQEDRRVIRLLFNEASAVIIADAEHAAEAVAELEDARSFEMRNIVEVDLDYSKGKDPLEDILSSNFERNMAQHIPGPKLKDCPDLESFLDAQRPYYQYREELAHLFKFPHLKMDVLKTLLRVGPFLDLKSGVSIEFRNTPPTPFMHFDYPLSTNPATRGQSLSAVFVGPQQSNWTRKDEMSADRVTVVRKLGKAGTHIAARQYTTVRRSAQPNSESPELKVEKAFSYDGGPSMAAFWSNKPHESSNENEWNYRFSARPREHFLELG